MALFDPNTNLSLEDALGNQAKNKIAGIEDTGVQNKRRLVAQEAHSGRLMSGVSDYPLGDLAAGKASDESDVYTGLAQALGQVPAEGYLNDMNLKRDDDLAQLIGRLNKKNGVESGLAGAEAGAAAGSTFGPWGTVIGGVGGGLYGAFG